MEVILASKSSQLYYDYPLHLHNCWEIVFSLTGSGQARIGTALFPFEVGTVFCIPPGTPHCKTATEGFVDGCLLVRNMAPLSEQTPMVCRDDGTLLTLFELAYRTQQEGAENAGQIIAAIGDVVYQKLLGLQMGGHSHSPAVERLQRSMLEHLTDPDYDLTEAIRTAGYHASYLRRLFRECYGRSPVDYFNHLRIDHAKRQLALYHTVRSIREIAAQCGFSDPYYFSRLFRNYEGRSPSDYIAGLGGESYELLSRGLSDEDPERQLRQEQRRRAEQED